MRKRASYGDHPLGRDSKTRCASLDRELRSACGVERYGTGTPAMVGTRRSRRKLAATSGVCVVLLGALAACGGGASATATQVPGYRVIHIEAGPNHPLYQILVEPGITPDQLRAITQAVIQKAQGDGRSASCG